jgi:hypothetical protein
MTEEQRTYEMESSCSNCGYKHNVTIPYGEPVPLMGSCGCCGVKGLHFYSPVTSRPISVKSDMESAKQTDIQSTTVKDSRPKMKLPKEIKNALDRQGMWENPRTGRMEFRPMEIEWE